MALGDITIKKCPYANTLRVMWKYGSPEPLVVNIIIIFMFVGAILLVKKK